MLKIVVQIKALLIRGGPPATRLEDRFAVVEDNTYIPYSQLYGHRNLSGESFRKLWFDVKMIASGTAVEFAVFAYAKRIGSSNV